MSSIEGAQIAFESILVGGDKYWKGNYEAVLKGQIKSRAHFEKNGFVYTDPNIVASNRYLDSMNNDVVAVMEEFGANYPTQYQSFLQQFPESDTAKAIAARQQEERRLDEQIEAAKRALAAASVPAAASNYGLTPGGQSAGRHSALRQSAVPVSQPTGIKQGSAPKRIAAQSPNKLVLIALLLAVAFVLYPVVAPMLKK